MDRVGLDRETLSDLGDGHGIAGFEEIVCVVSYPIEPWFPSFIFASLEHVFPLLFSRAEVDKYIRDMDTDGSGNIGFFDG